jgi:hypothetical protein
LFRNFTTSTEDATDLFTRTEIAIYGVVRIGCIAGPFFVPVAVALSVAISVAVIARATPLPATAVGIVSAAFTGAISLDAH